jgi:Do/DeqQ family serine protease
MKLKAALLLFTFFSLATPVSFAALPLVGSNGEPLPSLAPMLKKVNPAVVNISTYSTEQYQQNPLLNDPFFRRFFNIPEEQRRQQRQAQPRKRKQSAGSGVIVDASSGTVMTNYHVVKDSDEVQVALIDGRSFKAKIIGSDPELDIAILKIDADDLTEVVISDSSLMEVGDFVVAIGNPFGLGQTVTTGIVSALGRSGLGIEGYENFIQTDASINPGNSGGALVNLRGELVGINTAIIAPGGGNVGIGFAIPINMAKASMGQILDNGEVKRGQLGIGIQDLNHDLRESFKLANGQMGVLVTNVVEDSPAEKAGLKTGDVILEVDGKVTQSSGQLRSRIAVVAIGDKVTVKILRDGQSKRLKITVGDPKRISNLQGDLHPLLKGVQFENHPSGQGVSVVSLSSNSAAAYSGLRDGDLIIAVNRRRVKDLRDFKKAAERSESSMLLQINRSGGSLFIVIR